MQPGAIGAKLKHVAKHRDATPGARLRGERLQCHHHRCRVGIVAVRYERNAIPFASAPPVSRQTEADERGTGHLLRCAEFPRAIPRKGHVPPVVVAHERTLERREVRHFDHPARTHPLEHSEPVVVRPKHGKAIPRKRPEKRTLLFRNAILRLEELDVRRADG